MFSSYLQKLGVLPAYLLQESWEQGGVLLDDLPHLLKLGLVPQELKGVDWKTRKHMRKLNTILGTLTVSGNGNAKSHEQLHILYWSNKGSHHPVLHESKMILQSHISIPSTTRHL